MGIEQVIVLASDVLVVDHNTEKIGLAVSAAVRSNHPALVARNHMVLAPPKGRHGFQAPSAASRHRAKLLPTCYSDSAPFAICPSRCCMAVMSFLCFRVLYTSRRDKTIIAISPRPAPTPIPAFAFVERPEGSTENWTA